MNHLNTNIYYEIKNYSNRNSFLRKKKIKSFLIYFFYQDDFFNPTIAPALASRKKLNLENFLKILLNLAFRLVKIHLFTNRVLLNLIERLDSFNTAFHFKINEKLSFLIMFFKILEVNSCLLKSLRIFESF